MLEPLVVCSGSFCVSGVKGYVGGSQSGAVVVNANCGHCLHACMQLRCVCAVCGQAKSKAGPADMPYCSATGRLCCRGRREGSWPLWFHTPGAPLLLPLECGVRSRRLDWCGTPQMLPPCHCLVQCRFRPVTRHGLCCRNCVFRNEARGSQAVSTTPAR